MKDHYLLGIIMTPFEKNKHNLVNVSRLPILILIECLNFNTHLKNVLFDELLESFTIC